jgi:hypothetical protein
MSFRNILDLFSFNTHNRGDIRMDLDEAEYLYSIVEKAGNDLNSDPFQSNKYYPQVIEIGTYKGGSTKLLLEAGADVLTVDNYSSKTFKDYNHHPAEDVFILCSEYPSHRLRVLVENTRTYDSSNNRCDILFIDGDHSYEGVKADYENWIKTLKDGGDLIFHDACIARSGATGCEGVIKFMKEIKWMKYKEVGSLVHFKKELDA